MNNETILHDVIEHLMANPENSSIQNICEKIHIKILSSDKNYNSIIEILEDLANDELAELCRMNATTYDENIKNELKASMVNKLCYYYLGDEKSGNYFEKTETLNSFLDNKKAEHYIWQHKGNSCEDCKSLSKNIYTIDTIPYMPHPNCNCVVFSISDILLKNPNYMALNLTQSKTNAKAFESLLDGLQFLLDGVGLVPGFGEIADGTNALIYLARKDYANAALSGAAMIPVAGIFATGGKITSKVVKVISKADDVVDIEKGVKKAIDAVEDTGKAGKNLKPQDLIDELAQSGVKYTLEDVVIVTKTPDGKLMWLEKGNASSGLKHIVDGHAIDFANRGIADIPDFLNRVLQETPINTGIGKLGPFAEYLIDGKMYRVAYGTNGYIVSFFPID